MSSLLPLFGSLSPLLLRRRIFFLRNDRIPICSDVDDDCILPQHDGGVRRLLLCCCSNGEKSSFGSSHGGEEVVGFLTLEAVLPGANAILGDVDDEEIATAMNSDAAAAVVVFIIIYKSLSRIC